MYDNKEFNKFNAQILEIKTAIYHQLVKKNNLLKAKNDYIKDLKATKIDIENMNN